MVTLSTIVTDFAQMSTGGMILLIMFFAQMIRRKMRILFLHINQMPIV
mgnify:CR=1